MTSAQRGLSSTRGGTSRRQPFRQCRASRSCSSSSGEITRAAYLIVRRARVSIRTMLKTSILAAVLVASTAGLAHAGGQPGSIGVGAEFQINDLAGGASVNYDAGDFHVGGFFGFA